MTVAGSPMPPIPTAAGSAVGDRVHPDWSSRVWTWATSRLPLVAFLAVYIFSCQLGTLALILSERFRTLYLVITGAEPPDLTMTELLAAVLLLHIGPLLVWLGFEAGLRGGRRWLPTSDGGRWSEAAAGRVALVLFLTSATIAAWSVLRAGGLENFSAWGDYNAYVYARWRLFEHLRFFEFVNLYTLLPLLGGYLIVCERRWLTTGLVGGLVVLLQYPLANRKALLTSAILAAATLYVYLYLGRAPRRHAADRRQVWMAAGVPLGLYVAYVALTVMLVFREGSQPFQSKATDLPPPVPETRLAKAALTMRPRDVGGLADLFDDRRIGIVVYTALSPLVRSSITALVYPAVFPRLMPYYRLDVGLDILGYGAMPDDNLVVYRILWPQHHWGSVAAPFQYVLYSQGGVLVALGGAVVIGTLMGAAWALVIQPRRPRVSTALLGGVLVTYGVFLAIDSVRNSTIVSYGLAWALPVILVLALVERLEAGWEPPSP